MLFLQRRGRANKRISRYILRTSINHVYSKYIHHVESIKEQMEEAVQMDGGTY